MSRRGRRPGLERAVRLGDDRRGGGGAGGGGGGAGRARRAAQPGSRHFSRVGPFARVFGEEREAAEALPTSTRPGEEKGAGAGAGARSRTTQPATSTAFPEPPRATLTGNASRFESARANAEIDDWLEDEI